MSSTKLHPIYVALESHQYNRAVKLASALPPSNTLGQALLAHALLKSGAVAKALQVIRGLLWFDSVELDNEIERLGEISVAETTTPKHQPRSKKGAKNAKKRTAEEPPPVTPHRDLVDQLETALVLPEGWDQVAKNPDKQVISDEVRLLLFVLACLSCVSPIDLTPDTHSCLML